MTLMFGGLLIAQVAPTTRFSGEVMDSSGAYVPGAQVDLIMSGTQAVRHASTNGEGRFIFDLVPPGSYELNVSANGFAAFHQSGIQLDVNVPADVKVKLTVRGAVQQVNVIENAPMIDAESGTLRQVVNERYIHEMPLEGRNAAALVFMAPGTVTGKGTDKAPYASNSDTIAVSVNGTYGNQVAYKLDGATHEDNISNLNAAFPNPDALAEFSVETNNFDARYGGSGGAVVNIVTKSGTNSLHGSLFEYLRNNALNAKNYFATQDSLKRNQFGGSIGGPILHDKLFYFGSYQGTTIASNSNANLAVVPTAAERQGDFSAIKKQLVNPFTKAPFAGNQVPVSSFASSLFSKIPTSSDPAGQLRYAVPSEIRDHQGLAKLDYNLGKHQLSGSFFYVHYSDPGWNGNSTLLNYKIGQVQTTKEYKVSDNWTISSTLLNSVTFDGLNLDSIQTRTAPFSIFDFATINATKPAPQFQETGLNVTGFSGWGTGGSQPPGEWIRGNYEVSDVVTWMRGNHMLHMGATYDPYQKFDSKTGFQEEPVLKFDGTGSGNALADLMTGYVSSFTQTAGKAKFTRGPQISTFVQDTWRVHPRLSLDLGLRWEPFLPYTDPVQNQVGGFIPGFKSTRFPNAPVGLAFAGDPEFPDGGIFADTNNFAPRLGFSYALRQGAHPTTVRGGWGMFYIMPFMKLYNNFVQNAPFSPSVTLFGTNLFDPYASAGVTNPFPPFAPVNANASSQFVLPQQYQYFNTHWGLGHTNAFNLTIEQQLASDLVFRAAYVGTQGRDLQYFDERNPAIFKPGATVSNTNARRALAPTYASLLEMTNDGISNYNSLQLTLEKRFSSRFSIVTNYTYSKSLDNQSVDNQFTVSDPNPFDPHFNYGLSDFDTPRNLSIWGIYDLPQLNAAPWLLRAVAGGWETAGAFAWRSGTPFTVAAGQDRSLSGVGQDRADLIGDPTLSGDRSRAQQIAEYFNTAAFALNAPGTFGTSPRNLLRGPGLFNLDWSLQKSFGERHKTSIRADFFNAFNNVHLNGPGANVSSASTFGKITSAGDPRILQIAARYQF
ncbi:MAG TPA: carboxypeptidase regulatory-like domain-containing protein [Terriglobales bacterium]|nr:carboxypeptidase regulatory-like domain-containing protein [Terriglobales bacterium]